MAQMIKHVIAETVDHAGFDDRVVESGVAHDLFRFPLRLVIRRTTICSCPQETNQDDLLNPGGFGSFDNVTSAINMNTLVSLTANLTIDARTVSNRLTVSEQLSQYAGIRQVMRENSIVVPLPSGNQNQFVTLSFETMSEVCADKTVCSSDGDSHDCSPY